MTRGAAFAALLGQTPRGQALAADRALRRVVARGTLLLIGILSLAWWLAGGADPGTRALTGAEIVADLRILTAQERRDLEERRAAVETRVEEFARQMVTPCPSISGFVRNALASVDRIGAVNAGPILLTSDPPKLRVSYVVALTSGRLVPDEVIVVVPLQARVSPAGNEALGGRLRPCGGGVPRN